MPKNVHKTKTQSKDTIFITATASAIYCQYLVAIQQEFNRNIEGLKLAKLVDFTQISLQTGVKT